MRLLASLAVVAALVAAGTAGARTVTGTSGRDVLRGTLAADSIFGRGGDDEISGLAGDDFLQAGTGRDRVLAGLGNDRIALQSDGSRDGATCGDGRDVVTLDGSDRAAPDCEVVTRRISRRVGDVGGQAEAEVEPHNAASGRVVVAAFQVGRFADGGAARIGWARSSGGTTWRAGLLPGLLRAAEPGERVADPVVAFDRVHRTWLVASLRGEDEGDELLISRSANGLAWRSPVLAARASEGELDKEWLVCDNGARSRFRGHCYLSYWDTVVGGIETRVSTNGGASWSAPVPVFGPEAAGGNVNGAQLVVRPDGSIVLLFVTYVDGFASEIVAARSTDGARTFSAPVRAAAVEEVDVRGLRAPLIPSASVDADGRIYVAWHGPRADDPFAMNAIQLVSSANGVTWSRPQTIRASTGGGATSSEPFSPAIAVQPGTRGARARIGVVFYSRVDCWPIRCPGVDVMFAESANGGASWSAPQRLNAEPMRESWIADGGFGHMLADYISVAWVAGRPVAVFALASAPRSGRLEQSIYATRVPLPPLRRR